MSLPLLTIAARLLSLPSPSGMGDPPRLLLSLQPSMPGLLGAELCMMQVPTLLRSSMLSRLVMLARM
jgi:hypothetical protein